MQIEELKCQRGWQVFSIVLSAKILSTIFITKLDPLSSSVQKLSQKKIEHSPKKKRNLNKTGERFHINTTNASLNNTYTCVKPGKIPIIPTDILAQVSNNKPINYLQIRLSKLNNEMSKKKKKRFSKLYMIKPCVNQILLRFWIITHKLVL